MTTLIPALRELLDPAIARKSIANIEEANRVLEALEFEPGCEGSGHPLEIDGHVLGLPATWMTIPPCGMEQLKCAGWVNYLLQSTQIVGFRCPCGSKHMKSDTRFIPLNKATP